MRRALALAAAAAALTSLGACFDAELPRVTPRAGIATPADDVGDEAGASVMCGPVQRTEDLGADHLEAGTTHDYPEYPPSSGPHAAVALEAGVYDEPLSKEPAGSPEATIFRAVHSLEHGYVIVFHKDLRGSQVAALTEAFGDVRKMIIAPEPSLEEKVLLVAWLRRQSCSDLDLDAAEAFVKSFREKTAPEPGVA